MNARSIQMGTIIDAIAWAKSTLLVVVATPRGSPQRRAKLDELARATVKARELADAYQGNLAMELKLALRVAEMGLARFRIGSPDAATPGSDHAQGAGTQQERGEARRPSPRPSSSTGRRRVHPRRIARTTS